MPTLVVRHPDGAEREHPLEGEISIGRAEGNDLVLVAGGVSRKHARVFVRDGAVLVEDVGSANGTFVDGEKIAEPKPLSPKSELAIGDYKLHVKADAGAARPAPTRSPAKAASGRQPVGAGSGPPTRTLARRDKANGAPKFQPGGPPPRRPADPDRPPRAPLAKQEAGPPPEALGPSLRGLTGPWANKTFPVTARMIVGRVAGSDLQLDDDSVSRRHAELSSGPEGVLLKDLGSANGTLVNGNPVTEPVLLAPGDIVQFGVIEVAFQTPGMFGIRKRPEGGEEPADVPAVSGSARRLLMLGLVVFLLLGGGAFYKFVYLVQKGGGGGHNVAVDPSLIRQDSQSLLQDSLNLCRSYTSVEVGEPDWDKAELACNKALDVDPINTEATTLLKRIKIEQENYDHYQKADKAMLRLREEEALEEFAKIKPGSDYYLKAKPRVKEAITAILKKSADDCRRYVREGQYPSALPRCELYMRISCQSMEREDIVPPPGYTIRLSEGRLGRNEWRPKDPMLRLFLQARMRMDPKAPLWECPRMEVVQRDAAGPDMDRDVRVALQKRYSERMLYEPVFDYWKGRVDSATFTLQKLRANVQKADLHITADELRNKISQVEALFKAGQAALQAEDPVRAAVPFAEALEVDKALMQELAENKPSWHRRSIQQGISESSYKTGKFWADRGDFRKACKIWKTGFNFYRANLDLSRAILFCTSKGQEALQAATRCLDLPKVAELAVDGDGLKDQIEIRREQLKCPDLAVTAGNSPK